MIRRPAPALLAVMTCALGIGGASAMFGVVDGVLFQPLPYPDADRIVSVFPTIEEWRERSADARTGWDESFQAADRASFSWPEFEDWMGVQTSFDAAAALANGRATLTGLGPAAVLSGPYATPALFPMLGAEPVLGRTFDATDGMDSHRIVVSWSFWQTRLGGAQDAIGRTVLLDDRAHEVIGVLPRAFGLTGYDATSGEFWVTPNTIAIVITMIFVSSRG